MPSSMVQATEAPSARRPAAARATPWVVAVDMGYGHLRPAAALAEAFGTHVRRADAAPLADGRDRASLRRVHRLHVWLSRAPEVPIVGGAMRRVLDAATWIPRVRRRGALAAPNAAARHMSALLEKGFAR